MSPEPATWPRLADIAAQGDRLATMRALRDRLAADLDDCASARDVAALSRQLSQCLEIVDHLEQGQNVARSPLDDLAARRAGRDTGTTG